MKAWNNLAQPTIPRSTKMLANISRKLLHDTLAATGERIMKMAESGKNGVV